MMIDSERGGYIYMRIIMYVAESMLVPFGKAPRNCQA